MPNKVKDFSCEGLKKLHPLLKSEYPCMKTTLTKNAFRDVRTGYPGKGKSDWRLSNRFLL